MAEFVALLSLYGFMSYTWTNLPSLLSALMLGKILSVLQFLCSRELM